jgi:sterol desaturase/sphingolipid hydroxylase (fatty acid hydroxylase superfamily)
MDFLAWIQSISLGFVNQMKFLFLNEDSRLWWVWILLTFPLIGALFGAFELRRSQKPVTLTNLFAFVFPKKIYGSASFRNDVIIVFSLYALYAFVLFLLAGLEAKSLITKSVVFFNSGILDQMNLTAYKHFLPANVGMHLLFTFLVIVGYDFGFTMLHYAFHKVPFLWKFHKIHHSAEVLTPLTVARFHLFEYTLQKAVEGLCIGIVFGIFYYFYPEKIGLFTLFGLSLFGILFSAIGVFRHSHIWISYGFMNYIFCSPAMHQIHHSKEARHIDKNMSQIFSFWDYLLGTLYIPKERENFEVGLPDENDWNASASKKVIWSHFKA